jgi:HD superfamily phosphohydrolase
MRIRDPIHGTIPVADAEVPLLDSRLFQRLRHIKQLGFGEMAFPGATHTRHAHSIGAMHVASRLFDSVFAQVELPEAEKARLRRAVRVAVLLHDIGHMPLSHTSEHIAPPRAALGLPGWLPGGADARATHEDFTARLVLDSSLTPLLRKALQPIGVGPEAIAGLILGADPPAGPSFTAGGRDWGPLLRQLVSGELDADRMDYLLRDSVYTGVTYGRFDLDWLVQNLLPIEREGRVYLGLGKAAIFAFEDFLLSRFHMFVSVYFHHTSVNFDEMLRRYCQECPGELVFGGDVHLLGGKVGSLRQPLGPAHDGRHLVSPVESLLEDLRSHETGGPDECNLHARTSLGWRRTSLPNRRPGYSRPERS